MGRRFTNDEPTWDVGLRMMRSATTQHHSQFRVIKAGDFALTLAVLAIFSTAV